MQISNEDLEEFDKKGEEHDGMARIYIMEALKEICETDVFIPTHTPNDE